jgi:hypothetical protein
MESRRERTSSSAFLAPRIDRRRSRSPSPERRNESSMEDNDAGGAGYVNVSGVGGRSLVTTYQFLIPPLPTARAAKRHAKTYRRGL